MLFSGCSKVAPGHQISVCLGLEQDIVVKALGLVTVNGAESSTKTRLTDAGSNCGECRLRHESKLHGANGRATSRLL